MASLHKLPNGKHRIHWREAGKQKTMVFATKREARNQLDRIAVHESTTKTLKSHRLISLDEIIARWEKTKISNGHEAVHILKAGQSCRRTAALQKWTRTDHITPAEVEKWKATGAPRAGGTFRAVLRWARITLDQPVADRVLDLLSPARGKRAPKRPLLTADAVKTIQAQAAKFGPSCFLLIHCLSTYGWRPITAARLTVGDADVQNRTITTQVKSGDTVRHPLTAETALLMFYLVRDRKANEPLFLDPRSGNGWSLTGRGAIPDWFKMNCVDRAKVPWRVYDLKRWAITAMLRKGMRREQVVVFTGHRVLAQIDTYVLANDETQAEALAALEGPVSHPIVQQRVTDDARPRPSATNRFGETSVN